jgi:hypothetical protein
VYAIDQDEQRENAGRFCAYVHGSTLPIRCLADAQRFTFDQVENPDLVIWDLHESDEDERPAIFAVVVDEAITDGVRSGSQGASAT